MKGRLRAYVSAALDLLYPRRCEVCSASLNAGRDDARRWLCDGCFQGLPQVKAPFCKICGEVYEGSATDEFRCGNCADLKLHFDFAIAPYRADDAVRKVVHRFKYQHELHLRGLLSRLLGHVFHDSRLDALDHGEWTLVPVPLHHARERERQYNQAWELCRELSRHEGWRALNGMKRVRPTTAQASLSRSQRIENLRGAFAVCGSVLKKNTLRGGNVLLVDDVLTTGSTTSECARILRRDAGVEKVVVITVARG